jgi:hypothetical protein
MQQVSGAAQNLAKGADELRQLVAKFKVDDEIEKDIEAQKEKHKEELEKQQREKGEKKQKETAAARHFKH